MGSHPVSLDIGLYVARPSDSLKYSTDSSNILDGYPSNKIYVSVINPKRKMHLLFLVIMKHERVF